MAILGTAFSSFASYHWVADILSSFRVHYLLLLCPYGYLLLRQRDRWKTLLVAGCLFPNLWFTLPYWIPNTRTSTTSSSASTKSFRLGIFNVLRTNEEFQETLAFFTREEPDFLFLMEVQPAWNKHLEAIRDRYPFQHRMASNDYLGIVFLSKIPWSDLTVIHLGEVRNPSLDIRFSAESETGQAVRMILTHPLPPFGDALTRSRDQQLLDLAIRQKGSSPTLMAGDFNLTPWSPRFARILEAGDLRDASKGFGWTPTLGPIPTWLGGIKVDHVLCSQDVSIHSFAAKHTFYSDHRLVLCEFSLPSPSNPIVRPTPIGPELQE